MIHSYNMDSASNNVFERAVSIVQKANESIERGAVSLSELIDIAGNVLADIRDQSEGGQETVRDALAILNKEIIKRYGSLDRDSFLKDLRAIRQHDLANKLEKIYSTNAYTIEN